jgi:hypothetical protein
VLQGSVLRGHYEQALDRESAYEKLKAAQPASNEAPAKGRAARVPGTGASPTPAASAGGSLSDLIFGSTGPRGGHKEGMLESASRSAARSIGSGLGRQILRGMLGGILGGRR